MTSAMNVITIRTQTADGEETAAFRKRDPASIQIHLWREIERIPKGHVVHFVVANLDMTQEEFSEMVVQ